MSAAFKWTSDELQDMVMSYQRGETAQSIAKRYGTSHQVILPLLAKQGIVLRTSKEAHKKQTCDERYFQVIDTEEKAYWIGFLTADGCITKGKQSGDSPRVTINLGKQDYGHLVKFKQALQATQKISESEHSCSFTIYSTEMVKDLAMHGILPRKTFSTKPVQIAPNLERHYWRGVIDGDGTFSKNGGEMRLYGDYDVVVSFQSFVLSHCSQVHGKILKADNICNFMIKKQATHCMLEILYGNATVFLDRKFERAQKILTCSS